METPLERSPRVAAGAKLEALVGLRALFFRHPRHPTWNVEYQDCERNRLTGVIPVGEGAPESSFLVTVIVGLPIGMPLDCYRDVLEHGRHNCISIEDQQGCFGVPPTGITQQLVDSVLQVR